MVPILEFPPPTELIDQIDNVVAMIERDPALTLSNCRREPNKRLESMSVSQPSPITWKGGSCITLKKAYAISDTINTEANKA